MKSKRLSPIIVTTDLNDAEELISSIRTSGYAIRPTVTSSEETLLDELNSKTIDLILFDTVRSGFKLDQLSKIVKKSGKHLPIIALIHEATDSPESLLEFGIEDVVVRSNLEHLQHVVNRTFTAQSNWRALKDAEAQIREAEKRCQLLLESSKDAISYAHEGMHIYANRSYLDLFGFGEMEEIEGIPLMDLVIQDERGNVKEFLRQYSRGKNLEQTLSTILLAANGGEFEAELFFSPASIDGEECTQILIHRQIGDTKELEQQINYLSERDLMTGLYNRQYFIEKLKESVSDATRGLGNRSIILISLDRFEALKETHGISGSDLLLLDISKLIEAEIAEGDIACRYDGNRFIVLSNTWEVDNLKAYLERLNNAVGNHTSELDGHPISSPASLGANIIDENAPDAYEVITRAERAFKKAVAAGGDQGVIYSPKEGEMTQKQLDELWSKRLREAIKQNRTRLFFQPIVSLNEEDGERYNVMMRLLDDNDEAIAAENFMASAERTGEAKMLDRWVLHHALLNLSARLKQNLRTTLFVKLSASSLRDLDILQWLSDQLKEKRIPGELLVLEIKSGDAINHLRQVRDLHKGLRQLHCRLAIDDFGIGVNPLKMLKQIPGELLKFDSSLVEDLQNNAENQETIKTLTTQAHAENRMVIIQGVEDPQVLPILWGLDINFVQGNFLQAPTDHMN